MINQKKINDKIIIKESMMDQTCEEKTYMRALTLNTCNPIKQLSFNSVIKLLLVVSSSKIVV